MIYTSYFAKAKKFPYSVVPVSICAKAPSGYHGAQYHRLAPSYEILINYKADGDEDSYRKKYTEEILKPLNPESVLCQICKTTGFRLEDIKDNPDQHIALLCYEKPEDFCHRHLVADWLNEAGYSVEEWS